MKRPQKGESGAQLLARLSSRTDLTSIDPEVFGKSVPLVPTTSSSTPHRASSAGKLIEIYGAEGVGKTEMTIHYVAKACLPNSWNGLPLGGLGAKAVIIDTEFKYSIFRLGIVLERQILALLEKLKQTPKTDRPSLHKDCLSHSNKPNECKLHADLNSASSGSSEKTDQDITLNLEHHSISAKKRCAEDATVGLQKICKENATKEGKTNCDLASHVEADSMDETSSMQIGEREESVISEIDTFPAPQDVEALVEDALGRVQVMRVTSTEQLLAALLSLEHNLACDPQLSFVVIDSISAFYWSDKLTDLENPHCTESKMSPIARTISKYVLDFGLTVMVTKSALIGNKRKSYWEDDTTGSKRSRCVNESGDGRFTQSEPARKEKALSEHVEFLGKSWSSLSAKRILLTKSHDPIGRVERTAWCEDWPKGRLFTFVDDSFQFT